MVTRRDFIRSTCSACIALSVSGCRSGEQKRRKREVKLGPVSALTEGPNLFDLERIVVTKSGENLSAMSLVCTHQVCALNANEKGLFCPCHGSQFSWSGAVEVGPATEPLPRYAVSVVDGEVVVRIS